MILDGHFEGSLTEKQELYETGKELTKGGRCKYILCTISLTELTHLTGAM